MPPRSTRSSRWAGPNRAQRALDAANGDAQRAIEQLRGAAKQRVICARSQCYIGLLLTGVNAARHFVHAQSLLQGEDGEAVAATRQVQYVRQVGGSELVVDARDRRRSSAASSGDEKSATKVANGDSRRLP